MAGEKVDRPIELAGIVQGGPSDDGERIAFAFEDQAGQRYTFSCPHEAIPDIVGVLFGLADQAQSVRAGGEQKVPLQTRYMRRITADPQLDWNDHAVVLTLRCSTLPQRFLMTRDEWSRLQAAIRNLPSLPGPTMTH